MIDNKHNKKIKLKKKETYSGKGSLSILHTGPILGAEGHKTV